MDFKKIADKLQFNEILDKLSELSHAEPNKEKITNLEPFSDMFSANEEIDEIKIFYDILENVTFPQIEINDLSNIFLALKKEGGFLQPKELQLIHNLIKLSGNVQKLLKNLDDEYFKVKIKYQNKLHSFKYIENIIETSFDETGEFLDSASLELKSIRSKIRDTRNQILDKLNEFLFSGYFANVIQESIITIRNNRYVIPLKTHFSQKVKGIIQDYSSTKNTVYVEPEFVVNLNNKLAYLYQEEYNEKIKILTEITDIVKNNFYEIEESYQTLLILDFKLAKAKLGKKYNFLPINLNSEEVKIRQALNPILLLHKKQVVPIDIIFDNKQILIITGANTGGKTVAIKTLGLINLMAQCGIPVPAEKESKIRFFEKIFIDIGDSQDLFTDLSTFSAHIMNINSFLERADENTLILIDELGTGTDPKDGAALGRGIIEYLINKKSFAIITTHIEDLKFLNYIYSNVENVSVYFNENTIKPEYRLVYGVSGRSYAIKIAEKLNFNREVIELSKKFYDETSSEFLKKLIDIDNLKRDLIERERQLLLDKQAVRIEKEKYGKLKEKLSFEKERIKELIKEKYKKKYEKMLNEFEKFLKENKDFLTAREYAKIAEKKKKVVDNFKKELEREHVVIEKSDNKLSDFYIGANVKHLKTGAKGRVTNINVEDKKIEIVFENNLKLFLNYNEVTLVNENKSKNNNYSVSIENKNKLFSLNVIGKTVDEAIFEIEKTIDYAILRGHDKIEIIHGLGTGRLKRGIDNYLKECGYVKNYYSPIEISGGLGITMAELK